MRRVHEPAAYGPQGQCYWADTVAAEDWPRFEGAQRADVAVIGGGFTGLSAALHLAEAGLDAAVLEAEHPAWGASGRNGGFCCLGGAKAPSAILRRRHGTAGLLEWRASERAAVRTVAGLIERFDLAVDRTGRGETRLAHSPRAWARMREDAARAEAEYGVRPVLTPPEWLGQQGLGGTWHGAMTIPIGFALNPGKYHAGLATAAAGSGARLFAESPVQALEPERGGWILRTPRGVLRAGRVVIATNGYSAEDLPGWLGGRTLPVQSSVIVTRPLTAEDRAAQGWTGDQMAYDSRFLLHYFRLLPDGRFLFGMRGGRKATPVAQAAVSRRLRADFVQAFPAWRHVAITHEWSGLVCLMARLTPFVGAVPDHKGLFAALGYHGNGVAMASHAGRIVAALARGATPDTAYPAAMQARPWRWPFGRYRRALLAPVYALADALDG
jgi:glycine/D-amino acid oxidase-like deaminating enzyme